MDVEINKGNKVAILIGASGLVGGYCLNYLLEHHAYKKVITIGRKSIPSRNERHTHITIHFDKLEKLFPKFQGDDLFLCLGTTLSEAGSKKKFIKVDFTYNLTLAKMAEKRNFNQLLLISSVGADKDSFFFYNKVKGYLETEVKKLDFWSTHIFRPSILLGNRSEQRFGEQAAGRLGKFFDQLSGGLLNKYKPVEAEVVAKAMVGAAQRFKSGLHIYPSHQLQKLSEEYYSNKPKRKK